MTINIPEQVRGWLYIACSVGSLIAIYLGAKQIIGVDEMALWNGFTALVAALARFNLSTPEPEEKP